MSEPTVSDPNRDDDEREQTRALPTERHRDAGDVTAAESDHTPESESKASAGSATSAESRNRTNRRASIEAGIGQVNGPIDFHDIYLRVRGRSLLDVLLAALSMIGLSILSYWLLNVVL